MIVEFVSSMAALSDSSKSSHSEGSALTGFVTVSLVMSFGSKDVAGVEDGGMLSPRMELVPLGETEDCCRRTMRSGPVRRGLLGVLGVSGTSMMGREFFARSADLEDESGSETLVFFVDSLISGRSSVSRLRLV